MTIVRHFKSPITKALKVLRMSSAFKRKNGWSREVGAGFIKEDIMEAKIVELPHPEMIGLTINGFEITTQGFKTTILVRELNLRETEELLKWFEEYEKKQQITQLENALKTRKPYTDRDMERFEDAYREELRRR